MKRLLFVFSIFIVATMSYAQTEKSDSPVFTVNDVPLATEMSHVFYSDIPIRVKFGNAKSWIARNFGDYDSVLQLEDTENNRIIIKGGTPIKYDLTYLESKYQPQTFFFAEHYVFTMIIDFKDDRYRIKFENIYIMNAGKWEDGILPQEYLIPENVVSLKTRFGDNLNTNSNTSSAMHFRNAFYELYRSAVEAIDFVDEF